MKDVSSFKKSPVKRWRKKSESSVTKEQTRIKGLDPTQMTVTHAADSRKRTLVEKVEPSGSLTKKAKASVPGMHSIVCLTEKYLFFGI